jgi:hypothetical protein
VQVLRPSDERSRKDFGIAICGDAREDFVMAVSKLGRRLLWAGFVLAALARMGQKERNGLPRDESGPATVTPLTDSGSGRTAATHANTDNSRRELEPADAVSAAWRRSPDRRSAMIAAVAGLSLAYALGIGAFFSAYGGSATLIPGLM